MPYRFEKLDVWNLSLEYIDSVYALAEKLPKSEEYNLRSHIIQAVTSISLNIAEGSIGQSDEEQEGFVDMAIRSLIETVVCQHIIKRRGYIQEETLLDKVYEDSQMLAKKLQAFRRNISPYQIGENQPPYGDEDLIRQIHRQWSLVSL